MEKRDAVKSYRTPVWETQLSRLALRWEKKRPLTIRCAPFLTCVPFFLSVGNTTYKSAKTHFKHGYNGNKSLAKVATVQQFAVGAPCSWLCPRWKLEGTRKSWFADINEILRSESPRGGIWRDHTGPSWTHNLRETGTPEFKMVVPTVRVAHGIFVNWTAEPRWKESGKCDMCHAFGVPSRVTTLKGMNRQGCLYPSCSDNWTSDDVPWRGTLVIRR